jgi:uncharacterized membrane protein
MAKARLDDDHPPSQHRREPSPERHFRWRAGEITRLEGFCDVIFGFALTLLVVSLEAPRNYAALLADIRSLPAFGLCFVQLVMIWREHYQFSRRYGLEDPYMVFLNLVLMFIVLFYVYPLKFSFSLLLEQLSGGGLPADVGQHEASALLRIYGLGFALVFAVFALIYMHAFKLRRALALSPEEVHETRVSIEENAILSAAGLISLVLTFASTTLAGSWYFVLAPALLIHGIIARKRGKLLRREAASG